MLQLHCMSQHYTDVPCALWGVMQVLTPHLAARVQVSSKTVIDVAHVDLTRGCPQLAHAGYSTVASLNNYMVMRSLERRTGVVCAVTRC